MAIFLADQDFENAATVDVQLRGLVAVRVCSTEILTVPEGGTRHSSNKGVEGDSIRMIPLESLIDATGAILHGTLSPLSWAVVTIEVQRA